MGLSLFPHRWINEYQQINSGDCPAMYNLPIRGQVGSWGGGGHFRLLLAMETGDKFKHAGQLGLNSDCPNLHFIWEINSHINELQHFIIRNFYNVVRALRASPVPPTLLVIIIILVWTISIIAHLWNWHHVRWRNHWWNRHSATATSSWFGWFNFYDFIIEFSPIQLKQVTLIKQRSTVTIVL